MSKDDLSVVMFKILAYVDACEIQDKQPELREFYYDSDLVKTTKRRWDSAFRELLHSEYLYGAKLVPTKDGPVIFLQDDFGLTYKGEQFLKENPTMNKAKEFLGEAFNNVLNAVVSEAITSAFR